MAPLRLHTGPVHLDEDGDDLRAALADALGAHLGQPVVVEAERSYPNLLESVVGREIDLAWLPPALYVRADERQAIARVLRAERGQTGGSYQGAIFVRESSPIQQPSDLRGARVAWVDRDSSAGYLFPRAALRDAGIDVRRAFSSETFVTSHARVVRAVVDGTADCGATYVQLADPHDASKGIAIAGWTGFADRGALRAVIVSATIPSDTVCVLAGVPDADGIRDRLACFHERPGARTLLKGLLDAERLTIASPADYDVVRRALSA